MNHLDEILKTADELANLIERQPPIANPQALNTARMLCIRMKGADNYINEKAGEIEAHAERYFSARKHNAYPGGPFALRDKITLDLLNRIRRQVECLRNKP